MFISKKEQPNYYFYLGSKTVPPCQDNVYHLIVSKPLKISECQFKLLRENSLFTNSVNAIHARLPQPSNNRRVYVINNNSVVFQQNIEKFIPKEFTDLAEEFDDEPLLPEKLSTISQLKALKATKLLIKKGGRLTKKLKYTKKGVKMIRKGLNIKKLALKKVGKAVLKMSKGDKKILKKKGISKRGKGKGQSKKGKGKSSKRKSNKVKVPKSATEKGISSGEYGTLPKNSHEDINC
jgi:hypothetical protein